MSTLAYIEPKVGKLQVWLRILRRVDRIDPPGWFVFDCAIIRLKALPEQGARITPDFYRGVWIRFMFWFPFDRV